MRVDKKFFQIDRENNASILSAPDLEPRFCLDPGATNILWTPLIFYPNITRYLCLVVRASSVSNLHTSAFSVLDCHWAMVRGAPVYLLHLDAHPGGFQHPRTKMVDETNF